MVYIYLKLNKIEIKYQTKYLNKNKRKIEVKYIVTLIIFNNNIS